MLQCLGGYGKATDDVRYGKLYGDRQFLIERRRQNTEKRVNVSFMVRLTKKGSYIFNKYQFRHQSNQTQARLHVASLRLV
jgi:hypothetical protein